MPVADEDGGCCGMIAQADIARAAPERETAAFVKELSRAGDGPREHDLLDREERSRLAGADGDVADHGREHHDPGIVEDE